MHWETRLTNEAIGRYTAAGHWENRRLQDDVSIHVRESPAKVAILDRETAITYAEFGDLVDAAAAGLLSFGIRPRDVASVQLPNCWEFAVLALALERIGAAVNPVPTIMRQREMTAILASARSTLLVVPSSHRGFDHEAMAMELKAGAPSLKTVVVVGNRQTNTFPGWDDLFAASRAADYDRQVLDILAPDPNEVALLAFTSGTTDEPKGVMHTHNTLGAIIASTVRRQGLGSQTVSYMPLPLAHANGYYWGLRMPLHVGGTQVYADGWDAHDAIETIERTRATFFAGTPACLLDLLGAAGSTHDITSMTHFLCAGANLPPATLNRAIQELPIPVLPAFGMTENGYCIVADHDWPADRLLSRTGRPQPELEVRIVTEDGADCPPGAQGRLWLRGPQNFVGYSQGRGLSERYFPVDDWFDTGDLAELFDDGTVRITGRVKDVVRRGAETIPVKDIEDLLVEHPAVEEVAIVAVPDDRLGERACACVIPKPGMTITLAEIQSYLSARRVTKQYWPEHLQLHAFFPKTELGKIQKKELRAEALGMMDK